MKTITISTENSETYSSISNFFIDYYMTDANGEFVKVYLYLVRLLSNNSEITVAAIADHFNLTENDICRAIRYWISRDVLKLNYDGNGQLRGIVLLPLHSPTLEKRLSADVVSIMPNIAPASSPKLEEIKPQIKTSSKVVQFSEEPAYTIPAKVSLTKKNLIDKTNDPNWADIQYLVETLFGKPLSSSDMNTLIYVYEGLEFSIDLLEYLIEYCVEMKKKNCRYLEAVAIEWYKDGITTKQQAKEQNILLIGIANKVYSSLGIRRARPTSIELEYIATWYKDMGFSPELIEHAANKANMSSPTAGFAYVNGILENWHKESVKSISDVERLDKEHVAKQAAAKATHNLSNKVSSFTNYAQSKHDDELDEMEKLFLKEVNNK